MLPPDPGRRAGRRRWLVRLTGVPAVLVGLAACAGVLAYRSMKNNITSERVNDRLDERPVPAPAVAESADGGCGPQRSLNILLIGSDTRVGANAAHGGVGGARGDVTILLHLDADRKRAVAVSLPRDSILRIRGHLRPDGFIDGTGDIGRVKRQQAFLAAILQKANSGGVLTNPSRLYRFLDAATTSLTTDSRLANLNELRKLAQSVQGIGPDNVHFLTVPWKPYPADPNRVQWTTQADVLWKAIRTDSPLPGKKRDPPRTP